jgi:hypothetical protein
MLLAQAWEAAASRQAARSDRALRYGRRSKCVIDPAGNSIGVVTARVRGWETPARTVAGGIGSAETLAKSY